MRGVIYPATNIPSIVIAVSRSRSRSSTHELTRLRVMNARDMHGVPSRTLRRNTTQLARCRVVDEPCAPQRELNG
jgi:hypothetical protein